MDRDGNTVTCLWPRVTGTKVPSQCTAVKDTGLVKDIRLCQIPLVGPTITCSFSQSGREGSVGHSREAARPGHLSELCSHPSLQAPGDSSLPGRQRAAAGSFTAQFREEGQSFSACRRGSWRHLRVKAGPYRKCLPGQET